MGKNTAPLTPEPAQPVTSTVVDNWFSETFHNQPGLNISTELFNHIHAAKERLKAALAPTEKEA